MPLFKNLAGLKFGRLEAISHEIRDKKTYWYCICDCQNTATVRAQSLVEGVTKSCGCIQKEHPNALKHGMKHTPTYAVWKSMRQRCTNPNDKRYKDYGGRGIEVCPRWNIFENFFADMGEAPREHSIERINNDGNYEPGNCKWGTKYEQANNTRNNLRITFKGKTKTCAEWAIILGLGYQTLRQRIQKLKWPVDRALSRPLTPRGYHANDI